MNDLRQDLNGLLRKYIPTFVRNLMPAKLDELAADIADLSNRWQDRKIDAAISTLPQCRCREPTRRPKV